MPSEWPVPGLPQLRGARLGEGQPTPGALGHDVQRGLPVGAADDPQQAHGPAEGPGLHQVHSSGSGKQAEAPEGIFVCLVGFSFGKMDFSSNLHFPP